MEREKEMKLLNGPRNRNQEIRVTNTNSVGFLIRHGEYSYSTEDFYEAKDYVLDNTDPILAAEVETIFGYLKDNILSTVTFSNL
jgi:hypothetical protein